MLIQEKIYTQIPSVPLVAQSQRDVPDQAVLSVFRSAKAWVCVWVERSRQRRALRRLDDRLLDDIGLTREQVSRETSKPFWQQ